MFHVSVCSECTACVLTVRVQVRRLSILIYLILCLSVLLSLSLSLSHFFCPSLSNPLFFYHILNVFISTIFRVLSSQALFIPYCHHTSINLPSSISFAAYHFFVFLCSFVLFLFLTLISVLIFLYSLILFYFYSSLFYSRLLISFTHLFSSRLLFSYFLYFFSFSIFFSYFVRTDI